ncbi:hypothetical protein Mgra_00009040 [Meloidogyne graminicola]|uniref:Uncharacterized protein n=1 Tax=Meloidogyne graminicola TaxID=189291 RepID=A0A8S9ZE28_9BILA|nr:hypothetical protein Mgra_00009040 [Meloidogyne graminicola]
MVKNFAQADLQSKNTKIGRILNRIQQKDLQIDFIRGIVGLHTFGRVGYKQLKIDNYFMTLILIQHKIKVLESKDVGRPRIKSKIEEDEDFNK